MKITIVGPSYPLRGGIAHHVYWLHQQLTHRRHDVQVISFRKLYPRLLFPGSTQIDHSRLKLDAGGLKVLTPLNPVSWKRAAGAVESFGPDVVVFEWWQPFFAPLVGTLGRMFRRAGRKIVIECHNVLPHESTPAARQLIRFAFAPSEHFITHSISDRRELETLLEGKTVSVSALPALSEFYKRSNPSRSGRTALFFGKVRKYKGLPVLLKAMPRVLSQVECRLLIAGEFYDSEEKYRKLISDLGIAEQVRLENRYVPNEEVPALFEKADVLVLPYLSATQSGVAAIARMNSLPIIAARTGGLSEIVQDEVTGLLFSPGDPDALADALIAYFTKGLGPVFSGNLRSSQTGESDCRIVEIIEALALGSANDKQSQDK
jgi:glycosyltransferase involved in cell wall biosynthesis